MFPDSEIEQYKSLRRLAVHRSLTAEDVSAYVQARTFVSEQVLSEQRSQSGSGQTLRGQARARVHLPITMHLYEWETDTFIHDLSQGGCSLFLGERPKQDTFPFDLFLPGNIVVRGYAEIVATRQRGNGMHVSLRFRRLTEEAQALIEDVVLDALVGY